MEGVGEIKLTKSEIVLIIGAIIFVIISIACIIFTIAEFAGSHDCPVVKTRN